METRTLGKYELRSVLGRGAMGTVYEAWDPVIARRVAIKTVPLPEAAGEDVAQTLPRFRHEAQAAGRLIHPNVVAVFDYGETGDIAYIVMEFVEGRSLKSLLDARERLPLPRVLGIMEDVLAGLAHSHSHGVIHRDIKPSNIMLTPEGRAKIADFGIARLEDSGLTRAGTVLGTPAYMSPEQFTGEEADARSDLYSAGVVLYQLLTRERPFPGGTSAVHHQVLHGTPPRPSALSPAIPPSLDAVVARAMARRPEDRYPDAASFARALRAAMPQAAERPRDPARPISARRRLAGLLLAGGLVAALVAGGGLWFAWQDGIGGRRSPEELRRTVAAVVGATPCALVSGDATGNGTALLLDGLVAAQHAAPLRAALAQAAPGVALTWRVTAFDGPHCEAVELLRSLAAPFGTPAAGLAVATSDGRTHLEEGDRLVLRVTAPDFRARVQLDYLQTDGTTYHMQPSAAYPGAVQEPGSRLDWGEPRPGIAEPPTVQPPFGADMVMAIAAPSWLFHEPRPEIEPTADYLRELRAAIAAVRRRGEPVAGTALIIVVGPRR
ncbi:serine/threonine-protein kinase [Falsiroseomonas sp.]|uniref:serine/threonine-protein kinase n=1 Tax=Falsiroseomonas sp. TaxID=2870721 RepID=UPI0035632E6A